MALPIPKRFIGYGAFNLCFDRRLGRAPSTGGKNFFEFLRKDPRGWPVNLVKVICFRKSTADKLDPTRADPLFASGGSVNPAFLTNLQTLVTTAEGCGFFVQICVFSFQSVTSDDETPENVPRALDPGQLGGDNCARLKNFFNPDNSPTLQKQVEVAAQIAYAVRFQTNIIWEIANEARVQGCKPPTDNVAGNCKLVPWYNHIWDAIDGQLIPEVSLHTISTGVPNEGVMFTKQRPYQGCALEAPYRTSYYDFHADQWNAAGDYGGGMDAALNRLKGYDYPAATFTVNDDGARDLRTNDAVRRWASAAFQRGLHYMSKQPYPPAETFNYDVLNILRDVNNANPVR
ncbi:MAG TPA: hypothetical protein VHU19_09400 [Pyrinomonadaceae bacterium]|jgi:hypothetical protein|nr:hypothetical protein [Pyrinomonadaceae bacterium]